MAIARANQIRGTGRHVRRIHAFISHTAIEAPIALLLKELLQSSFPGLVTVFASSDARDETPGERWFPKIEAALLAARAIEVGNHADKGGERELLRTATVRSLRESLDFLSALSPDEQQ